MGASGANAWSLVACNASTRKKLGLDIDYDSVKKVMEETSECRELECIDNYFKYIIFEDKEDIQKAYGDVHRILDSLDEDAKNKALNTISYKLIMKEWEKINN